MRHEGERERRKEMQHTKHNTNKSNFILQPEGGNDTDRDKWREGQREGGIWKKRERERRKEIRHEEERERETERDKTHKSQYKQI